MQKLVATAEATIATLDNEKQSVAKELEETINVSSAPIIYDLLSSHGYSYDLLNAAPQGRTHSGC